MSKRTPKLFSKKKSLFFQTVYTVVEKSVPNDVCTNINMSPYVRTLDYALVCDKTLKVIKEKWSIISAINITSFQTTCPSLNSKKKPHV